MNLLPSRQSVRGYVVWTALLVAAGIAGVQVFHSVSPAKDRPITAGETAAFDSFSQAVALDSITQREAWEQRFPPYGRHSRSGWQHNEKYHPHPVETFPFDPNNADSITFLRLGLRPWQAHNALQYRRRGGVWRSAEHFSKLYGLDEADIRRLAPYIRIDSTATRRGHRLSTSSNNGNGMGAVGDGATNRLQKYAPGSITLNLNDCDTTELQRIPEIGSYRARLIVQYRDQLGGYICTAQLHEIQGLPQGIESWFTVEPNDRPETLNVNKASFQSLVRHPYLNYEQVREIMNYRNRFGRLTSLEDLRLSPHFSPADLQRLTPYLDF